MIPEGPTWATGPTLPQNFTPATVKGQSGPVTVSLPGKGGKKTSVPATSLPPMDTPEQAQDVLARARAARMSGALKGAAETYAAFLESQATFALKRFEKIQQKDAADAETARVQAAAEKAARIRSKQGAINAAQRNLSGMREARLRARAERQGAEADRAATEQKVAAQVATLRDEFGDRVPEDAFDRLMKGETAEHIAGSLRRTDESGDMEKNDAAKRKAYAAAEKWMEQRDRDGGAPIDETPEQRQDALRRRVVIELLAQGVKVPDHVLRAHNLMPE